ncbi:unnamed protein product [Cladocopium goreaui]|uniref:Uncharacterized protein n=1 Tax=Cladocopium goreaui TaxID=2562237 RepID=A0A9P1C5B3_9DINO|nr:unnamed protein product [Cladocopium goreaui]
MAWQAHIESPSTSPWRRCCFEGGHEDDRQRWKTESLVTRHWNLVATPGAGSRGRRYPVHCSGECLCDLAMSWDKIIINNHKYTVK